MPPFRYQGIEKDWSPITLGCWQIAPSGGWGDACDPATADAVVKTALDNGITAFDTAEGYGDGESERRLGKALGGKKDDVVVISKIWPSAELSLPAYRKRLEESLRALHRDYVDVYLIHWPGEYFNTREKSKRLSDIMTALRESEKATLVGLSNFHEQDLLLLGDGIAPFSLNEVPYNLLRREYEGESREICKKAGIAYMAFSPTGQGLLADRISEADRQFPARRNNKLYSEPLFSQSLPVRDALRQIAAETGEKPILAALAWVLAQDNIATAIVGSRKPNQVAEFASAGEFELSGEQLDRLTRLSDAFAGNSA